jgi:membrane fusion protein, multidrug efflux system
LGGVGWSRVVARKWVPWAATAVVLAGVGVGGFVWWQDQQAFVTTDNAYVEADTTTISPQIEGYVAEVLVTDNQWVRPGEALVRLDTRELEARLAEAQANVTALQAAARNVDDRRVAEQAAIAERQAAVADAEAEARRAQADFARYQQLAGSGWVSEQRLQTVRAGSDRAQAGVAQAAAALETERREAASLGSTKAQTLAQAEQAKAAVAQARLDLERAVIRAPAAGVVGARSVRPGQYVRPGTTLMSVVPLGRTYVTANFKETQVARLRLGQPVEIRADAFGDEPIAGRVESFAPATGQEFALIPVENAVGNFTKVVQRLPVRIAVDPADKLAGALRPGLSVKVKVDARVEDGRSFAEAAAADAALAAAR